MRFVLAISALVLSGIMLVLGIGQVTFLAGPHQVTFTQQFNAPNGLAVLEAEQFGVVTGQANVVVQGEGAFVAVGHSRDVAAWAAPFAHAQVVADATASSLKLSAVPKDTVASEEYAARAEVEDQKDLVIPSPFGSDLWQEQRAVAQADPKTAAAETKASVEAGIQVPAADLVRLPVSLAPHEAVIVSVAEASDPTLSIEWVQDRSTPWAGPLLVGGGAFAFIGALMYLWAVDHDRRGLGPRRGRRGPLLGLRNVFGRPKSKKGPSATSPMQTAKRYAVVPVFAVTAALTISGCAPSYWPDFSQTNEDPIATTEPEIVASGAPVPVSTQQISRIISEVSALAGAADESLDAALLESRFTADALTERQANYTIRKSVSDYEVIVPRITDEELGYQLVQSTESWPRTIFVVVASEMAEATPTEGDDLAPEQDSPSLALIMTQQSPHENFMVSRAIALRGGITMPEATPAEEGTALLADDLQTLLLTPAEVGPAYAAVLQNGIGAAEAVNFNLEGDSLIERSGAAWVAQSAEAATAGGQGITYAVTAAQSDAEIVSLSTGVGGGFVTTTVLETRTEAPAEGSRWRPTVPKSLTALSGLEGQQEMLVSVVAHQLLFFVPSKDSKDKIQLLGYTSDLISASNS